MGKGGNGATGRKQLRREWGGRRARRRKEEEGEEMVGWRKEEEEEEDEEGKRRYKAHPKDREWTDVGKRVKLVVDNKATAEVMNRKAVCRNVFFKSVLEPLMWTRAGVRALIPTAL